MRALLSGPLPRPGPAAPDGAATDPVLAAGAASLEARRSSVFTRFDGNLHGLPVPSPAGGITSATRLEGWAVCPYAYFVKEILRVEPVESPEDRLQISPLDLGNLIHEVLERFIAGILDGPPEDLPGPDEPWSLADRDRILAIADEVCDRYEAHGLVGRPIFWHRARRRIMTDLIRFLHADSDHRGQFATTPVAAELAFGLAGAALPAVELPLPGGRQVRFRGKADRLDVATDGTLEVVDYKTGRSERYAGLSEDEPDARGTKLQLVVYALAARLHQGAPDAPVRSEYWFTSARGGFTRVGYPVTPQVLARVGATVGLMAAAIEDGVFPPHPTATSTSPFVECPYCDPDALGVVDLRRQIDRKSGDAALAAFLELAEGTLGAVVDGTEAASG